MINGASLIVPVYNEEDIITENTLALLEYLDHALDEYEVILVENGSVDNTLTYVEQLAAENPEIRGITLPEPSLGEAIKTGVANALYDKLIYFPIDLSVNLSFIKESVELLDSYEIVVGSKKLETARDHRPLKRRIASSGYHRAVQVLFNTDLSDTTCVKSYQRDIAQELMRGIPSGSSVFETEVLLEAQRMGLNIAQIPVTVTDPRRGRLPLRYKMAAKGQDLFSLRVDVFSMITGGILFITGLIWMIYLSLEKLVFNRGGFLNPYSFLISMLLILFGAQGIAYGLFARLFLQLRLEITSSNSRHSSGNVFKEEAR